MSNAIEAVIDAAWLERESIGPSAGDEVREAVDTAISALDSGSARIAEKVDGAWVVHQWLKKAVLLSFRLNPMTMIPGGPGGAHWWDKVPSKFAGWGGQEFEDAAFRAVPGAIVRRGAFIAPGAVLMPCFVNIGARVGEGTMIDTWADVGSCAKIGSNVHIRAGRHCGRARPLQAGPVIIEDDCFIGARAPKSPKASSSSRAGGSRWACSSVPRPRSSTACGEVMYGRVAAYRWSSRNAASQGRRAVAACAVIVKGSITHRSKTSSTTGCATSQ